MSLDDLEEAVQQGVLYYDSWRDVCDGDTVRIYRTQKEYDAGWDNCWVEEMDEHVNDGRLYTVRQVEGDSGIRLNEINGICWPWRSLEKIIGSQLPLPF